MNSQSYKSPIFLYVLSFIIGIISFVVVGGLFILTISGGLQVSQNFLMNNRPALISIQVIQMITFFIIPPVVYALISKNDIPSIYNLNKPVKWKKYVLGTLIALSMFPCVIFLHDIMVNLPWPEYLVNLAEKQKIQSEAVLKLFLDSNSFLNFIMMIGIVGFGAGLTEELFFRGFTMKILYEKSHMPWVSIIISGVLFAVLHMSVYDMVPYILVGIFLGYLYFTTEDLKLNIFIHALFNGFQVLLNYLYNIKVLNVNIDEVESFPIWAVAISAYILVVSVYQLKKNYSKQSL